MSSKKKRRKEKWLLREAKRNQHKESLKKQREATTIEEMAEAMGIKLK